MHSKKNILLKASRIGLSILSLGFANYIVQKKVAKKTRLNWVNDNNFMKINGVNTHVMIKGEGEPLLLIHGSQMNLYDWRENIDFFSKYYKVIAFDMLGCGFTDKPKIKYTVDDFADFINDVMKHFEISKASFVGSSWGGGHVLLFALKYPDKVDKLILSSPCGFKHERHLVDRVLATPILGQYAVAVFNSRATIRAQLERAVGDKNFVDEQFVDSVFVPLYTQGAVNSTAKAYQNENFNFVETNLEKIHAHTLLVWGEKDAIHPRWMMDEMHRRIKQNELYIIENAGHLPHEEMPQLFNKKSIEFLRGATDF